MKAKPSLIKYFYQDPNGDLYRYNFGFSILNQFPFTGSGNWRACRCWLGFGGKMTSASGTTWVARNRFRPHTIVQH